MKKIMALLAGAIMMAATSAMAVPFLDFNMDANHYTDSYVKYDGNSNPLVGHNLSVDYVLGKNTPLNAGVNQAITNGSLNFATGNIISFSNGIWDFAGGGSITVTGTIPGISNVSNPILTGTFTHATVKPSDTNLFEVIIAAFVDTKDPNLLAYYGFPTDVNYSGNMNLSFFLTTGPDAITHGFYTNTADIGSGDITNIPTPEPGTIVLLGAGLAGLGLYGRRKIKK